MGIPELLPLIKRIEVENANRRRTILVNASDQHAIEMAVLRVDYLTQVCRLKLVRWQKSGKDAHFEEVKGALQTLVEAHGGCYLQHLNSAPAKAVTKEA